MKTKQIIAPVMGIHKELPGDAIPDQAMTNCLNVRIKEGRVCTRTGYTAIGQVLDDAINGMFSFQEFDGTYRLFAFTKNIGYVWNTTESCWEAQSNRTKLDCCDDSPVGWVGKTNVTAALSTTSPKEGTGFVTLTIGANFTTGLAAYFNDTAWDDGTQDWTGYDYFGMWVKSTVAQAAGDLQFVISENADAGGAGNVEIDLPALTANQWKYCVIAAPAGISAMNAVTSIGIKVVTDNGACVVSIDDIRGITSFTSNADSDFWEAACIRVENPSPEYTLTPIFTNGVEVIQKWTAAAGLATLSGSPPKARHIASMKSYIVVADLTVGSDRIYQRIQWCDTGEPTDWSGGNAGYKELPGADRIMALVVMKNDYLAVLRQKSIWLMWQTEDSANDVFDIEQRVEGIGAVAGRTAKTCDGDVIFMSEDNVYRFDGLTCTPVGDPIKDQLFATVNEDEIERAFALVYEKEGEYWLFVPNTGATYPAITYVYNFRTKAWTIWKFTASMTVAGQHVLNTSLYINDLSMLIDQMNLLIDDYRMTAQSPMYILGDSSGYSYKVNEATQDDNGTAIVKSCETKDFSLEDYATESRLVWIDVVWCGSNLRLFVSNNKGETWKEFSSVYGASGQSSETRDRYFGRKGGDTIRLRFQTTGSEAWHKLVRYILGWNPGGRKI